MFAIGMVPVSPLSYNLCSSSRQRFPSIAVRKALSSSVRSLRLGHTKSSRGDIPLFFVPSLPNPTLHRFVHLGLSVRGNTNISFPRLTVVSDSNDDDETATEDDEEIDNLASTQGKKVYTEYSVIGENFLLVSFNKLPVCYLLNNFKCQLGFLRNSRGWKMLVSFRSPWCLYQTGKSIT